MAARPGYVLQRTCEGPCGQIKAAGDFEGNRKKCKSCKVAEATAQKKKVAREDPDTSIRRALKKQSDKLKSDEKAKMLEEDNMKFLVALAQKPCHYCCLPRDPGKSLRSCYLLHWAAMHFWLF